MRLICEKNGRCHVSSRPHTAKLHTIDPTRSHKYSDSIQTIRILTAVTFSQARSYFRIFQNDQYPIPISSNINTNHIVHQRSILHTKCLTSELLKLTIKNKMNHPIRVEMGNQGFDCDCLLSNNCQHKKNKVRSHFGGNKEGLRNLESLGRRIIPLLCRN